eukprot:15136268-Heterocapsa_arctica.AAC.1
MAEAHAGQVTATDAASCVVRRLPSDGPESASGNGRLRAGVRELLPTTRRSNGAEEGGPHPACQ